MRRPRPVFVTLLIAALGLVALSHRQPSEPTWVVPVKSMAEFDVQVVDENTRASIAGAIIKTPSLIGTPYEDQRVTTDNNGKARLIYFAQAQMILTSITVREQSMRSVHVAALAPGFVIRYRPFP